MSDAGSSESVDGVSQLLRLATRTVKIYSRKAVDLEVEKPGEFDSHHHLAPEAAGPRPAFLEAVLYCPMWFKSSAARSLQQIHDLEQPACTFSRRINNE